jgi:hypothetical protein
VAGVHAEALGDEFGQLPLSYEAGRTEIPMTDDHPYEIKVTREEHLP